MNKKSLTGPALWILLALNLLGLFCLIWFAVPYLRHDPGVPNPEAMIPMAKWEGSGFVLTLGFFPLAAVNLIAFLLVGRGKLRWFVRAVFLIPCILCLLIVIHFWSGAFIADGSSPASPLVRVKLRQRNGTETTCCQIYEDGGLEALDEDFPVSSDNFLIAEIGMSMGTGGPINKVESLWMKTAGGESIKADAAMQRLFDEIIATIQHPISKTKIFIVGEQYFVAAELNVNWHDPCVFYRYDKETSQLLFLHQWEDMTVVGAVK